jgi:predicted RNA binding protein YcfA (HicA-like mRNA interferase family)
MATEDKKAAIPFMEGVMEWWSIGVLEKPNAHKDLQKAGFVDRGGKGSHRNFVHPNVTKPITISGKESENAKRYQEKAVRLALEEVKR